MKAVLCTRLGGPGDLEIADLPDPVPAPDEVVVRIRAIGLNFFDTLIIAGKYQRKPDLPFSPGAEFAGTIEALGTGIKDREIGQRVAGYVPFGAARERLVIRPNRLARIPQEVDDEEAAGISVTYGTTLYGLKDRAKLQPGETLAVLGASGGVGLAAIELGKLMGARVIACVSSDEKANFARSHGADVALNYSVDNLREGLRHLTDGKGVDVVYDPVGGAYAEPALRSLGWYGRYLVVGFAAGEIPKIPLNLVLLKSCDVIGVFWGTWTEREPEAHSANTETLLRWRAEGKLSAHVYQAYPLAEAPRALNDLAERRAMGKVILRA